MIVLNVGFIFLILGLFVSVPVRAAGKPERIVAAHLQLTGDEAPFGIGSLEGIRFAIDEANTLDPTADLKLVPYDDGGDDQAAMKVAREIVAGPASVVVGPALSTCSLAAGPIYAAAGLASITTTSTSDLITRNRTTYRIVFKNSDQGELLAAYVARVLSRERVTVVWLDNGYGASLKAGFERAAARFDLKPTYFAIKTPNDIDTMMVASAVAPPDDPIVLLTLIGEGTRLVAGLRRAGYTGPILGDDSFGDASFAETLAGTPEESARRGALTDGVRGLSPMIIDSAGADVLTFAEGFRRRYGHDPSWFAVAGYDAARAAIAAVTAKPALAALDRDGSRAAALAFLESLNDEGGALPGLLGPIWFDRDHGRRTGIRVGVFNQGRYESAPVQIVPVTNPDPGDLAAHTAFQMAPDRFVRRQSVVHTGMFLNEIPWLDIPRLSFGADLYLWMRYAAGERGSDPALFDFPDLVQGSSEAVVPVSQLALDDGMVYRLWRVRGEFRADFDLHRYPVDEQRLTVRLFNSSGASDRVVYVTDDAASTTGPIAGPGRTAAAEAFRDLTQWDAMSVRTGRDALVTKSALGDPRLKAAGQSRELSGFKITVDLRRRVVATLIKSLLPIVLMAMIMYATLHFPPVMIKEKIAVAVTAALTGAVLLSSINAQLGAVGYVMAVEYVFYVFFALCLFSIVSALSAEQLRVVNRGALASRVDRAGQFLFIIAFLGVAIALGLALWR